MGKVDLGFAAADALDHYMNRYCDATAKEMGEKLGVAASTVGRWRGNPFSQVEPEKIVLIKNLCAETWPSPEKIAEMEDEWDGCLISERRGCYSKSRGTCVPLDDDSYNERAEQKEYERTVAKRKNEMHYKRVVMLEKKYSLPELRGKYFRSIRYNLLIELSKDLSMHLPDIIEKYPQCKGIIYHNDQKFWGTNANKSLVELANISQENLSRNDRFNVFTKNEQQQLVGCFPAIIVIALLILAVI